MISNTHQRRISCSSDYLIVVLFVRSRQATLQPRSAICETPAEPRSHEPVVLALTARAGWTAFACSNLHSPALIPPAL